MTAMLCGSAGKEQPLKPIAAAKNTRAAPRLPFIIAMQSLADKAMQQDSGCQFDITFAMRPHGSAQETRGKNCAFARSHSRQIEIKWGFSGF
ncbi:MAG TPA: hypothetical protein VJL82_07625 [Rhizomicrobium sp.]|nr:hypothetical protein [Rhizomicrobium sp.]